MLKKNCVYFYPDRPCSFHKETGVICDYCRHYRPLNARILIIKLGALGDVLRTTPLIKPLMKFYSLRGENCRISWVTYEEAIPVLQNINEIAEILPYNSMTLARLMVERYDLLLNLDLSPDALALSSVVNAKNKKGFGLDSRGNPSWLNPQAKKWFEMSHDDVLKKKNKKTYQVHIFEIAGLNVKKTIPEIMLNLSHEEIAFSKNRAAQIGLHEDSLQIGLNTGGGDVWEKKEWPADSVITLIRLLPKKLKGKKIEILLFGGEKEAKRNKYILKNTEGRALDMGTQNNLREFFALLNLCDIIVSTDTLALHAALALKKRTIALFGPTSAAEIEMYGLGAKVQAPTDCVVCYRRKCVKKPDCMSLLKPETVYKSIQDSV